MEVEISPIPQPMANPYRRHAAHGYITGAACVLDGSVVGFGMWDAPPLKQVGDGFNWAIGSGTL